MAQNADAICFAVALSATSQNPRKIFSVTGRTRADAVAYSGEQRLVRQKECLWRAFAPLRPSAESGGALQTSDRLTRRRYRFNFDFQLPADLLPSYEDPRQKANCSAYIRYYLKAVLRRPWRCKKEQRMPLRVERVVDLSKTPLIAHPIETRRLANLGWRWLVNERRVNAKAS